MGERMYEHCITNQRHSYTVNQLYSYLTNQRYSYLTNQRCSQVTLTDFCLSPLHQNRERGYFSCSH